MSTQIPGFITVKARRAVAAISLAHGQKSKDVEERKDLFLQWYCTRERARRKERAERPLARLWRRLFGRPYPDTSMPSKEEARAIFWKRNGGFSSEDLEGVPANAITPASYYEENEVRNLRRLLDAAQRLADDQEMLIPIPDAVDINFKDFA